ncbi:MAG: UvrD-helicase domain-containing protein, partial [Ruminococcus sp.]|nr:UvrD-helicase domain-containing protein [Ruminococcus sp.]
DIDVWEIFNNKRKTYKSIIEKNINKKYSSMEQDYKISGEITEIISEMIRKYHEIIWEKKCIKNSITFDDGERLVLQILTDTDSNGNIIQSETARKTAEFYDVIMVDEYQDSNNKQDMIFKLISKNYYHDNNGNSFYGTNAFLVGDVKQSIYRFRLANPKNFVRTLDYSEEYKPDSSALNKKVFLNENFRSTLEVIDFVNYVFGNIMSKQCGDIDYDENEKLHKEKYSGERDNERLTHISFISESDIEEDSENKCQEEEKSVIRKKADNDKPNAEAVFTARKIYNMLRNGYKVTVEDETRPCQPSDFCILVRNNKFINQYSKELEKLGIPARSYEEKGYLESREISVLLDVLRVINNPLTDISLMAVLTSPMYMFSNPEMAFIKSLDNKKPLFVIILGIVRGDYLNCDALLIKKCRNFTESLDKFRLYSVTMTVGELIGKIYDTTDFISVMQLYNDGDKKRANLRILIQYANDFEKSASYDGTGGLKGFLRYIDRVIENDSYKQGKTSAPYGNYVSIMTLHSSKGLEFTFVFMAENNIKFRNDSDTVMCSQDSRIGYYLYDRQNFRKYDTFQRDVLCKENEVDTRSEAMRLMYVGFTRAKQKLFINIKFNEKKITELICKYISADGNIESLICDA